MSSAPRLAFEDFVPGRTFETGGRVVSASDVEAFAELSGDRNPLHLDDEAARAAGFEGRIAQGALGIAVATGLWSAQGATRGSLVALVGLDWQFQAPIRPGDTIRLRVRVVEQRARPGRDHGIVRFAIDVLNQADVLVQRGTLTELIRTA